MSERSIAVSTHVLGILTLFVGPLVLYLLFKKKGEGWLRDHLDESLNYNILVLAAAILLVILAIVFTAVGLPMVAFAVGLLSVVVLPIKVILEIVAAVKAGQGKPFHFPLDIKMIK